jgi:hypothetical protein
MRADYCIGIGEAEFEIGETEDQTREHLRRRLLDMIVTSESHRLESRGNVR